jgi:hypothetical protein
VVGSETEHVAKPPPTIRKVAFIEGVEQVRAAIACKVACSTSQDLAYRLLGLGAYGLICAPNFVPLSPRRSTVVVRLAGRGS